MSTTPITDALYRALVEQTRDYAVFVLDPEGHIATWNAGAERIKGYAPKDILGRHFSVFYPPEANARGWPAHELEMAKAEGRFEDEGWRLRKDGTRFWASVVITALRDEHGRLLGFSKITRDLTQRRRYEEALRQSEERFRLLVEGVVDYAVFMLDPEGVVSSWNAGAQRIKGYAPDEIVGKHFSRFYTEEDREAGKPWEVLASARRDGRVEHEGWRLKKDGTRFWARVVLTALHDPEGQLRGFAKVTQDLTQRRQVEDLTKAANNLAEFIAVLAHELRNPLAPIRAAVEVMARTPPADAVHEQLRGTIERQSAQLARIVEDMIDIGRITHGSLAVERVPVDMAEAVRRALEGAAPAIAERRHHLVVEVPEGRLVVDGDLHRLTQLLANVLNNAARYTAPGGTIGITGRAEEGCAVVRVTDTGQGIPAELIGRIFDMFVQGRTALERVGGGLGIGLALARRIAELHDGSLEARSEGEGKGAELTLRLPLSPSARIAEPDAGRDTASRPVAAWRVLVVDDNEDAAATLALLLRALGHETRVAHDGREALRAAAQFEPDVVLLDIGLPDVDGYEVARRLRALDSAHKFRIVAVTGWGQEHDRQRSAEAGFDLHLVKPVGTDELFRALQEQDGGERNGATLH